MIFMPTIVYSIAHNFSFPLVDYMVTPDWPYTISFSWVVQRRDDGNVISGCGQERMSLEGQ